MPWWGWLIIFVPVGVFGPFLLWIIPTLAELYRLRTHHRRYH